VSASNTPASGPSVKIVLITTLLLVLLLAACAALILGYFRLRKAVDARLSIERTLRTQSRLRSELLDLVPFPISIRDHDGVYVDLNSATANFMGLTREAMLGSTVDQCIALADVHALPRNQVIDAIHA
jgi:PAS domain-containing protein